MKDKFIVFSFDVEEFDTPLEYGKDLALEEQFSVSKKGFDNLLEVMTETNTTSTLFCTANFALRYPNDIIAASASHEIASHGYFHSSFKNEDLLNSKLTLENLLGKPVIGYRMARMAPVDPIEIERAGYLYNSSLNPTWLPGRYNHLNQPKSPFWEGKVLQIPASVTPYLRFPLFWLSIKNFPIQMMKFASKRTLESTGCVNYYFHPWEFTDVKNSKIYGLPLFVSKGSDGAMLEKLKKLINWAKKNGEIITFQQYSEYLSSKLSREH